MTADQARGSRPAVLFLCVHNAGRSQMAAGLLEHLADGAVEVFSGGSAPAAAVNPVAVEAMRERGIDISAREPRPWTEESLDHADVVVTMGCGDACPVLPSKRYVDWDLQDPAGKDLDTVRRIRDDIEGRVRTLMAELAATGALDARAWTGGNAGANPVTSVEGTQRNDDPPRSGV